MTNMSIQPLWLTHFIEILLVLEFQLTKFIVGAFSYKAHFRPQISSIVIPNLPASDLEAILLSEEYASPCHSCFQAYDATTLHMFLWKLQR